VLPLVTAKTVVLVGVFHRYRRFGAHDAVALDPYRAWHAPDGEILVSGMRDDIGAALSPADILKDPAMSDSEHSLEAIAYWLKHARPEVEIVPIIVPVASFPRLQELAARVGATIATSMKMRGWQLGRDVAIVISSDAVHYGSDFNYTPYGEGGVEAYVKACDRDRQLLRGPLAGPVSADKAREFFSTCVNPDKPAEYRMTWCGRFSVPFGLMLLEKVASSLGIGPIEGNPLAYGTSISGPEPPLRAVGLGQTAPANLFHFVGQPGVLYTRSH
jgi:MEMO1 family protein